MTTGEIEEESASRKTCRPALSYQQLVYQAMATGAYRSIGSASTFGIVRPSAELVVTNLLGKPPRRSALFFKVGLQTQLAWLLAAAVAGFVLGFTHAVVSGTFSNYLSQFLGHSRFTFKRRNGRSFLQRLQNLLIDVVCYDLFSVIFFSLAGALRSGLFYNTQTSSLFRMMFSSGIGGFFTGSFSYLVKISQPHNYSSELRPHIVPEKRVSFFTQFELEIGKLIREQDFRSWFSQFCARVIAGFVMRPSCVLAGAYVRLALENGETISDKRALAAVEGMSRSFTFEVGWFAIVRACGFFLDYYLKFTTKGQYREREQAEGVSPDSHAIFENGHKSWS